MRTPYVTPFILLTLVLSAGTTLAEPAKAAPGLSLIVELSDGSRVLGVADLKTLPFIAQYGKMDLVMSEVATVELNEDRETARITMKNGDRLQGILSLGDLPLETLVGKVTVPVAHVIRIEVPAPKKEKEGE